MLEDLLNYIAKLLDDEKEKPGGCEATARLFLTPCSMNW